MQSSCFFYFIKNLKINFVGVGTPSTPIHHVVEPLSRLPAPINFIRVQYLPSGHEPFVCDAFEILRIYYIGLKIVHCLIDCFTR